MFKKILFLSFVFITLTFNYSFAISDASIADNARLTNYYKGKVTKIEIDYSINPIGQDTMSYLTIPVNETKAIIENLDVFGEYILFLRAKGEIDGLEATMFNLETEVMVEPGKTTNLDAKLKLNGKLPVPIKIKNPIGTYQEGAAYLVQVDNESGNLVSSGTMAIYHNGELDFHLFAIRPFKPCQIKLKINNNDMIFDFDIMKIIENDIIELEPIVENQTGVIDISIQLGERDIYNIPEDYSSIEEALAEINKTKKKSAIIIEPGFYTINSNVIDYGIDVVITSYSREEVIIRSEYNVFFVTSGAKLALDGLTIERTGYDPQAFFPPSAIMSDMDSILIINNCDIKSTQHCVYMNNNLNAEISNSRFTGTNPEAISVGIQVSNSDILTEDTGVKIRNCEFNDLYYGIDTALTNNEVETENNIFINCVQNIKN